MLFKGTAVHECFKVSVPRRGIDQYIKTEKVAQNGAYALLQCERILNGINIDELRYLLCKIEALQYLERFLVKAESVVQYAAHQVIALKL